MEQLSFLCKIIGKRNLCTEDMQVLPVLCIRFLLIIHITVQLQFSTSTITASKQIMILNKYVADLFWFTYMNFAEIIHNLTNIYIYIYILIHIFVSIFLTITPLGCPSSSFSYYSVNLVFNFYGSFLPAKLQLNKLASTNI